LLSSSLSTDFINTQELRDGVTSLVDKRVMDALASRGHGHGGDGDGGEVPHRADHDGMDAERASKRRCDSTLDVQ
jgi:hypothetical protein